MGGEFDQLRPHTISILEIQRIQKERTMRNRELSCLPGAPASLTSNLFGAATIIFRKALRNRLLILLVLVLVASLARAQSIFDCSSFSSSGSCGAAFFFPLNENFDVVGSPGVYDPLLSGSALELAIPTANHTALNLNYSVAAVNDQAFQSNFTYVPDGWNISFVLQNNTNQNSGGNPSNPPTFVSGEGCEGSIYQAFSTFPTSPNNIFALMLDQHSPLTDASGSAQGGGNGSFSYSSVQMYQQNQDPCNPRDGTEKYFYFTKKISTAPVPLNSPASNVNVPTGDTYSVTITYTGSNVTMQLYDVTAGGSCPGSKCFTYTWNNVSIPSLVGSTKAWAGLAESTNQPSGFPLLVRSWSFTSLSAAATPTISPSAGTYGSTQTVTITDSSSGSIICYNTTGNPATNGIGGCANGTLYSGSFSVSEGQTVYAIAGSGTSSYGDSAVASNNYDITGSAAQPTFSVSSGAYQGNQTLILTAAHGGVICYNTTGSPATNGSTGCSTGTQYTTPITISSNESIYSVAGGTGLIDSGVGSATYIINQFWGTYADSPVPSATPTFSPLPGTYSGSKSVTLASTTSGAYICYSVSSTPLTVPPYPDSMGGCAVGTLYSGPISVSSSQILYAIAGTTLTTYSYCGSESSGCTGTSAPSTLTAGSYTIGVQGSGQTPGAPTNVKGSAVPQ
jgi:hypothetical protein